MQQKEVNEKIIYTYVGINSDGDEDVYYIYDPATDKHHKITKEKYEKIMKNTH